MGNSCIQGTDSWNHLTRITVRLIFFYSGLFAAYPSFCRFQWSSGNMSNCSVWGCRFKSHHGQLLVLEGVWVVGQQNAGIADTLQLTDCCHGNHFLAFCIWVAHWRHLASTTELSVCSSDAAWCQITLTTCYLLFDRIAVLCTKMWPILLLT